VINKKKKIIFVHIPRCGGVSITLSDPIFNTEPNFDAHLRLNDYSLKGYFGTQGPNEYFKFAFVRNPWDRLVSIYNFWKQQDESHPFWEWDSHRSLYIKDNNISFRRFVREVFKKNPIFFKDKRCSDFAVPHLRECFQYIEGGIDFVGRFENLQKDFNTVCDKIGIDRITLPHKNKSRHKHYSKYYNRKTRKIVAEMYANDIKNFGYSFES